MAETPKLSETASLVSAVERAEKQVAQYLQRSSTRIDGAFDRISGWLILGNTGALVLLFQTVLSRPPCATPFLKNLLLPFVVSLALAFASVVAQQAFVWFIHRLAHRMVGIVERARDVAIMEVELGELGRNADRIRKAAKDLHETMMELARGPAAVAIVLTLLVGGAVALFSVGIAAASSAVTNIAETCAVS